LNTPVCWASMFQSFQSPLFLLLQGLVLLVTSRSLLSLISVYSQIFFYPLGIWVCDPYLEFTYTRPIISHKTNTNKISKPLSCSSWTEETYEKTGH
jgi:hypothetical protein